MEGDTTVAVSIDLDHKNDQLASILNTHHNKLQQPLRRHSHSNNPNANSSQFVRVSSADERHTLPEIPRNPLTATVAHVVARELG
jgi:hypothetical protein